MKKFWAIACVIAFTAFWTFGLLALAGLFGDRPFDWVSAVIAVLGLGAGVFARIQVNAATRDIKSGLHVRVDETKNATWEDVRA
ncbi:hypothetical protein [Tropicimonas sp. S265A]|uniref:hypothetical protein n=1 Tax=Tropicimonas sp. S265A TaxID=3415134 RepID=UPI003C7E0BE3